MCTPQHTFGTPDESVVRVSVNENQFLLGGFTDWDPLQSFVCQGTRSLRVINKACLAELFVDVVDASRVFGVQVTGRAQLAVIPHTYIIAKARFEGS